MQQTPVERSAADKERSKRPRESSFSAENWDLLSRFWHPIVYGSDLGAKPLPIRLLDQRLVVYRAGRRVVVANDVCIHRGAPLSRGWIADETLVCPYHGLRFDGSGRCVAIPPAGPVAHIPPKLRLTTYPVAERYGIVWTCLSPEPLAPLPEWPGMEQMNLQKVKLAPADWDCSAFRHVENFNDVAHFSFVHAGTFGDPTAPIVARYDVAPSANGLRRSMPVNQVDRDSFGKGSDQTTVMEYDYDYTLPFNSSLVISSPDGRDEYIYDAVCPVSSAKSRIFI
ncbi:MAG: Rieske 2Fe-2S domain-containing protein [Rhizobiales bacterium]|nr:Rieske 2Fe-2S domain-containing protein [Hyphomicrobiales bacterium]